MTPNELRERKGWVDPQRGRNPEDIMRLMTYDPTGTDPDPQPGPMHRPRISPTAIALGFLAILAIGIGIGAALP